MQVTVDLSLFDAFRLAYAKEQLRAAENAVRVGTFQLRAAVVAYLQSGGGGSFPPPKPLTLKERLWQNRGLPALAALSRAVLYSVTRDASGITGKVGFTAYTSAAGVSGGNRLTPGLVRKYLHALEGGAHTITRERVQEIAAKIRRQSSSGISAWEAGVVKTLGRMGFAKKRALQLGGRARPRGVSLKLPFLPRVGTVVSWPRRQAIEDVAAREGARVAETVRNAFAMQLAGLRVLGRAA